MNLEKASIFKVGAICAFLVGICYVVIVILAFFSPTSIISYQANDQYFRDFYSYKNIFIVLKCIMVVANASLVGVVIAVYKLNNLKYKGIIAFFSLLAIIGLGIGMLQSLTDATVVPHLAKRYETSTPEVQHVIIAFGVANPAIYALSLGLPGLWFMIVSYSFRKSFSKLLVFLGMMWGLGNILTVVAHMLILTWLIYFIETGALILAPIWGVLQSQFLWRSYKESAGIVNERKMKN